MPGQKRKPRSDTGQPQEAFQDKVVRGFRGMNSQKSRQSLEDGEYAWLENVMPLADGTGIIVPGPSAALAAVQSGIIYTMQPFSRGGTHFMFVATTTGHAYEVTLDFAGYTVTGIQITNPGTGYTVAQGITFIGSATTPAVVTLNLTLYDCAPFLNGSGYTAGDVLTLTAGTFLRAAKIQVTAVDGGGQPTSLAVIDGGDYSSAFTGSSVTGGTGSGAFICTSPGIAIPGRVLPQVGFGLGGSVIIVNGGAGYAAAPQCVVTGLHAPGFVTGQAAALVTGTPHAITEITNPGAPELSGSGVDISQWQGDRILIVDPVKGFFDWNGSKLTPPGSVISLTITTPGQYTAIPNITFSGGGGAGAAATANMGINGPQTVTAGGSGYLVGDILSVVGGTSTETAQVKVTTVSGTAITAVAVFDPGNYTVLPTNPVTTKGGSGNAAATLTLNWGVLSATMTNTGTSPYTSAPTVAFSAGVATATANLVASPSVCQIVATYAERVWVLSNGRTLNWTAPSTYNDFIGPGSGVKILEQPVLGVGVTQLIPANGFLYYTGSNSVSVISDVTVNANGDTVFSDNDLQSDIGAPFSQTVIPYFRSLLFLDPSGVYAQNGSTPTKISDAMDGVFQDIDFHGLVSAGTVTLNNTRCAAFLVLYNPTGQTSTTANSRPLLLVHFNKKWFVANQDGAGRLIVIAGGPANDPNHSQNLYGTDGTSIFKLFDPNTDAQVAWRIDTPYWDMGFPTQDKQALALGVECDNSIGGTINVAMQMIQKDPPFKKENDYTIDFDESVQWQNDALAIVTWTNAQGQTTNWTNEGYVLDLQEAEAIGKYVGVSLTSSVMQGEITSIMLRYLFRGKW